MDCPKCSTPQADDHVECASCGIVFARWREIQDRARLASTPSPMMTGSERASGLTIPLPVIFVVLVAIFTLGTAWTVHSKRARASSTGSMDNLLNEINQKGIETRRNLAADAARKQKGEPPLNPAWREAWDRAVSPGTTGVRDGLAGRINQMRAAAPETIDVILGLPVDVRNQTTLVRLEQADYVQFIRDADGVLCSRFTPAGRARASSGWTLISERDGVTSWRIPIARSEIISVVRQESDGVSTRLLVSFRWVPTSTGEVLGYKLAGPFTELIEVFERPGGDELDLAVLTTESKWPARR